jgi:hypothetical protein
MLNVIMLSVVMLNIVALSKFHTILEKLGFSSNRWSRLLGSLVAQTFNGVTDKKSSSILIY